MKHILILLVISLFYSSYGVAAERLDWKIPDGWKIGYQKGNIIELVQSSESVKNWTRLITFQQYESSKTTNGIQWINLMEKGFAKNCAEVELIPLKDGKQKGYEIAHVILSCTKNLLNGKGEIYQVKTIKGKERFFVAQYAYRVAPFKKGSIPLEKKEVERTIDYMAKLLIVER